MTAYAHSKNAQGKRQDLIEHLQAVAQLTQAFTAAFDAGELGYYLGLWHDLGKFHTDWQKKLLEAERTEEATGKRQRIGIDHKAAGALMAQQHLQATAPMLVLQGHHGGLKSPALLQSWFRKDFQTQPRAREALALAEAVMPVPLTPDEKLPLPAFLGQDVLALELLLRFLFSALVDADVLDTERHGDADRSERRGSDVALDELLARLEAHVAAFGPPATTVNQVRAEILAACRAAASGPPGLFRLTVPTGGGKTLAGMDFALRHAIAHGMQRIIVAVPYMTITEQTAQVYRAALERADENVVLEHHSGAVERQSDEEDDEQLWQRLAAENWDAPIIITTTVQLFESLFANRTARCRKVHRLARSVILLDEAQTLPLTLLTPILDAMRQLTTNYGSSVVLSTATQPAWEAIPIFAETVTREIVPEPERFFQALKRVQYDWSRAKTKLTWEEVAGLVRGEQQVLVVLNTKKDALALLNALADSDALHLSTMLCGAHRRRVIAEVKRRLTAGEPCRLIATQVVEAGVDVDFPLVLRALGPLDSILQAAGRANREGRRDMGRMIVFETSEGRTPPGIYAEATNHTRNLVGSGPIDADDPATIHNYFSRFYGDQDTDLKEIQKCRRKADYPEVAKKFQMIDQATVSVIVMDYGTVAERRMVEQLLADVRTGRANLRRALRRLQPFMVSLASHEAQRHRAWISPFVEALQGVGVWCGGYDAGSDGLIGGRGLAERAAEEFVL